MRPAGLETRDTADLEVCATHICLAGDDVEFKLERTHVVAPKRILAVFEAGKEMVACSLDCRASVTGGRFNLYRQFRHRLGALSVFMIHAGAAQHPGHLGLLS